MLCGADANICPPLLLHPCRYGGDEVDLTQGMRNCE